MSDILLGIFIIIAFVIGPFWLISEIGKGGLFTGQPTGGKKTLAIVLGVIFLGIFIVELLSSQTIHIVFPILGVALISYGLYMMGRGLGTGQLLIELQGWINKTLDKQDEIKQSFQSRVIRFGKAILIVLIISAIVLYGAIWAASHPDSPLSIAFVIGILLIFGLGWIFGHFF